MNDSGETVVVGLSCDYHDAAAAVLVGGDLAAAAEEERFSRVKHDSSLPVQALVACLASVGVTPAQVDHVVYYEKPLPLVARFWATRQRQGPRGALSFAHAAPELVGRNLVIGPRVARMFRRLGVSDAPQISFVEHHRSHAAAAFFPSPFEHAAVLTIDGLGEWATATVGVGARHRLTLLEEQRFPHSIGLVYSWFTAYCGFRPNDDEYKLMGLAPYGTPRFVESMSDLVRVNEDGSVWIDAAAFDWFTLRPRRSGRLAQRFEGGPRTADAPLTQREADLAASVQQLVETVVLRLAATAHRLTGETNVCLAGGVALNCVAIGRLLREGPFDRVWVQPAAGDAGSAVGAALSFWHESLGAERSVEGERDQMRGGFLGVDLPEASELDCELERLGVAHVSASDDDALAAQVAGRLAAGDVVGWCQGRMEFGPRALGHRSILADPRSRTVRHRLNAEVKGRESFRPFAPAVLDERAQEWFELGQSSPYMSIVAPVRSASEDAANNSTGSIDERSGSPVGPIPACTHVDGSARVQTVAERENPELHRLLVAFEKATGCPVLLNTSFNRAGEPIVATVESALDTAARAGLDLLVVGNSLVDGPALRARAEVIGR